MWFTENKLFKRPKYDKDVECSIHDGYCHECEAPPTIYPKNHHNVKYVIEYEPRNDKSLFEYSDNIEFINMANSTIENLHNIQLIGYKHINLHNINGFNDDHRGSNHCKVKLKFFDDYLISTPLTAHELALAYYRVKSHKWDNNYELYCDCENIADDYTDTLNVYLHFDHGS